MKAYTALLDGTPVSSILRDPRSSSVRPAIRAAAVRVSVSLVFQKSLQRVAIAVIVPLSLAAVFLLNLAIGYRWDLHRSPRSTTIAVVAGFSISAASLIVAVAYSRLLFHLAASFLTALIGGYMLVAVSGPPGILTQDLVTILFAPATAYAAFLPLIAVAQYVAWRLGVIIDPRARIVVGLLRCVRTAVEPRWRYTTADRNRLIRTIESVSRTAERDLPRLLPRRGSDTATALWLRTRSQAIAARLRECKQGILMNPQTAVNAVPRDLCNLLVAACADDWDQIDTHTQASTSRPRTLLRAALRRLGAAAALASAGVALPIVFHAALKGTAGIDLRDVLVVAGVTALIPLPADSLQRIPDTFGDVFKH